MSFFKLSITSPEQTLLIANFIKKMAGAGGFEPPHAGIKILCLCRLTTPHKKTEQAINVEFFQRVAGNILKPATHGKPVFKII
jgi:hypothetical protein